MEAIFDKILPAALGLVGGGVGSLVAPWVNWRIERVRMRITERRTFIAEARKFVGGAVTLKAESFQNQPIFARLRPYLTEETLEMMKRDHQAQEFRVQLSKDITALEAKWKLI